MITFILDTVQVFFYTLVKQKGNHMNFNIKCATFVRLASICSFFEPETPLETRQQIETVRLEAINGKIIAIATNQRIAAIELIGHCQPDRREVAHVRIDPAIVMQCKLEAFLDGVLTIETIPEIATGIAYTSSGWRFNGQACHWFDETLMDDWRKWAPDQVPTESDGIMMWNTYHVHALMESSPTGKVIFPRHVDTKVPVVLRDRGNENWVGLFMPKPHGEIQKIPATLPIWWNQ